MKCGQLAVGEVRGGDLPCESRMCSKATRQAHSPSSRRQYKRSPICEPVVEQREKDILCHEHCIVQSPHCLTTSHLLRERLEVVGPPRHQQPIERGRRRCCAPGLLLLLLLTKGKRAQEDQVSLNRILCLIR